MDPELGADDTQCPAFVQFANRKILRCAVNHRKILHAVTEDLAKP
jgi:hypothetical protein